jgi:hypothetical protein
MAPQSISVITNSPSFQHELAVRRAKLDDLVLAQVGNASNEVADAIRDGARAAVRRLVQAVDSVDESIAVRASSDILDRAGFPRAARVEQRSVSITLTAEDAARISDTMKMVSGVPVASIALDDSKSKEERD